MLDPPIDRGRNRRAREVCHLLQVVGRDLVGLVEDHGQFASLAVCLFQQLELCAGDRRVWADDDQGDIDPRNEGLRRGGVGRGHRTKRRRVHQAQAAVQNRAGQSDLHHGCPALIRWIPALVDEGPDILHRDRLLAAVDEMDERTGTVGMTKNRYNGGDRHHTDRQNRLADQRIDQSELAAFELSDAGHEEARLLEPPLLCLSVGGQVVGAKFPG